MENVPFGDSLVSVMGAELLQRPIGDVLPAAPPFFVVSVERESIGNHLLAKSKVRNYIRTINDNNPPVPIPIPCSQITRLSGFCLPAWDKMDGKR